MNRLLAAAALLLCVSAAMSGCFGKNGTIEGGGTSASPSPSPTLSASPSPTATATASPTKTTSPSPAKPSPSPTASVTPEQAVKAQAKLALDALKKLDMEALGKLVDPDAGVRFSPYAYVDTKKDLVFQVSKLKTLLNDKTIYTWGAYDGSGEPINLTFADYLKRFVNDQDYAAAPKTAYNQLIGKGNTSNNLKDAYPDASYVEYHYPGVDPKLDGHDWKSLRLIFHEKGGKWLLIGIQHDQWTI